MSQKDYLSLAIAHCDADLKLCSQLMAERIQSSVPLIPQLGLHVLSAGGKRIRPLLTILSSKLCLYPAETKNIRHILLAACVEFIHTATLLHDDVVDESDLRRGQASANALFGNQASVLVGDFLFSKAFQIMFEDGSLDVLGVLSSASTTLSEGEILQLTTQNNLSTTLSSYIEVISSKTASLFSAACQLGAIVAMKSKTVQQDLATYGFQLGIAFQLIDDILDYQTVTDEKFGKAIGNDFKEGKITLPLLLAYQKATDDEKKFWERTIGQQKQEKTDLDIAISLIKKYNANQETKELAQKYVEQAKKSLMSFPDCQYKEDMINLADYAVSRLF